MTNPFDLDALDLQVNLIQIPEGQVEPQTAKLCVAISLLSHLCCEVVSAVARCR